MNPETFNHLDARDLRRSAIHECGHAFVARHYGMLDDSKIWLRTGKDEGLWYDNIRLEATQITPLRRCRVALAGKVAEYFDINGFHDKEEDRWALFDMLHDSLDRHYNNKSDWTWVDWQGSQGWGVADACAIYMILRRNWQALLGDVEMRTSKIFEND